MLVLNAAKRMNRIKSLYTLWHIILELLQKGSGVLRQGLYSSPQAGDHFQP